ncbi:sensor histidine kinase [Limnochorda pilosa]|nr:ATP-binding protein [Limnochorda pilosa]
MRGFLRHLSRPGWQPSLRVRLTLWYAVALVLVLGAFNGFVYWRTSRQGLMEERAILDAHARQLVSELDWQEGRARLPSLPAFDPAGTAAALYDARLRLLFTSFAPAQQAAVDRLAAGLPISGETFVQARFGDETWLVRSFPIQTEDGSQQSGGPTEAWALVARSLEPLETSRRSFLLQMLAATPIALALTVAGGLFLAGRALAPIDSLTRTARAIGRDNLSGRVPPPATEDELGRLAQAFNEMLDRLEAAFARERRFTQDASHELRTPAAALLAQAEAALARSRDAADYRRSLEVIRDLAQRMSSLVEELMLLARLDAGAERMESKPVDLTQLGVAVAGFMKELADRRGIRLELAPTTGAPVQAIGDESRLLRVLLNLVDNAVRYSPSGGRVEIRTGLDGPTAWIEVADRGPGIAPEHLPHLFERFYRAEPSRTRSGERSGAGLGLSIAQAIVKAHGGRLRVASTPGAGSTFRVELPAGGA